MQTNSMRFHYARRQLIIAHQHKRRKVHLLTSAELRFFYKGKQKEKVRKMSWFVKTEDKILNEKRIVGEKRKFVL
jgi:hypothetical protein